MAAFAAEAKAEAAAAAVSAVRTVTATVTQLVDASLARAAAAQEASTRSIATQLDRISAADADAPRARAAAMRLGAMEGSGVAIKQVLPEVLARVDALEKKIDVRVDALEKKIDVRVDALEKKIDAILAATASAPPASAATASEPPAATSSTDVRTRCRMLASSGDYDSAVYRAVEQSDVDVLLYALDAVGIDKVRTMSPLPFGQLTLLCLVQQLGTTLARDDAVDFKLEWLQLAVLGLDASNPRIADHVPAVLLQVKACMEGLPAAVTARHRERISLLVGGASRSGRPPRAGPDFCRPPTRRSRCTRQLRAPTFGKESRPSFNGRCQALLAYRWWLLGARSAAGPSRDINAARCRATQRDGPRAP